MQKQIPVPDSNKVIGSKLHKFLDKKARCPTKSNKVVNFTKNPVTKSSTIKQGQRYKHNKLTTLDPELPNKDKSCQLHTKSHHKNPVLNREQVATQTSK
jgi:hypothetical protein